MANKKYHHEDAVIHSEAVKSTNTVHLGRKARTNVTHANRKPIYFKTLAADISTEPGTPLQSPCVAACYESGDEWRA